ncbi:unnamed protein product [Tuber melanosporum]|uniref:(Perigord truffle) hypothetical protein n=1 Tax=Tuber melanosporum (strain Mel28) TaxID=656061 RepID=D5GEI3_TUBMM|nr:uncharacterized protein GSTUM_00006502001 [Tuber melanosporum]CAZ82926.1 unnamed protein product [Tuber melanosporum]
MHQLHSRDGSTRYSISTSTYIASYTWMIRKTYTNTKRI